MLSHAKSMLVSPPDAAIERLFPPCTADGVEALEVVDPGHFYPGDLRD
jgi:hypothetical protein